MFLHIDVSFTMLVPTSVFSPSRMLLVLGRTLDVIALSASRARLPVCEQDQDRPGVH